LETSDDFKVSEKKPEPTKDLIIKDLKITVRKLTKAQVFTMLVILPLAHDQLLRTQ
jgi:serine protease Do